MDGPKPGQPHGTLPMLSPSGCLAQSRTTCYADQAACRGPYWLLLAVGALAALASSATADDELYASTTSADGRRTNAFYRHGKPLTAVEASAKCAAMGGRLLSLQSPAQVNESLWASNVVAAADTSLIW